MYSVRKISKNTWGILELDTDTVIQKNLREKDARSITRSLNLGAGFNGFTPAFFAQPIKQKKRPSKK